MLFRSLGSQAGLKHLVPHSEGTVLRQRPAGLAHEPNGYVVVGLAAAGREERAHAATLASSGHRGRCGREDVVGAAGLAAGQVGASALCGLRRDRRCRIFAAANFEIGPRGLHHEYLGARAPNGRDLAREEPGVPHDHR